MQYWDWYPSLIQECVWGHNVESVRAIWQWFITAAINDRDNEWLIYSLLGITSRLPTLTWVIQKLCHKGINKEISNHVIYPVEAEAVL